MFRCPHCGDRSISLLGKFFGSRSDPIECGACKGLSAPVRVVHYQFVIGVLYLAVSANLIADPALRAPDLAVLALILSIKLFVPIRTIN